MALLFAMKNLNIRIVTAGTMEINKPMISIIKKSKMKIDAILPKRFIFNNMEIGLLKASIINK